MDGGWSSSITFATGVGVDPVVGSNYKLTLRSAKDTVSVGGLSAKGISLFLITSQTAKFNIDPFSGIQGTSLLGPRRIVRASEIDYIYNRHGRYCVRHLRSPRKPGHTMCVGSRHAAGPRRLILIFFSAVQPVRDAKGCRQRRAHTRWHRPQ